MKYILNIFFVFAFFGFSLSQKEKSRSVKHENKIGNIDCFGAASLCGSDSIFQEYSFPKGTCVYGKTKLYYTFQGNFDSTIVLGTLNTSSTSTYSIYGPFDQFQDGCERINAITITADSSDSDTTHIVEVKTLIDKYYLIEVIIDDCAGYLSFQLNTEVINCGRELTCENCIPQFNPGEGLYIISAWVKQADAAPSVTNYSDPHVKISFPSTSSTFDFYPSGQIIDGWQRIEGTFDVSSSGDMILELLSDGDPCYFDDIRIFPYDGSMISYVYDPITLRLVAELDERNYAKIYEYDEEGKLIRVKKETEKGIMTIQENRENSVKQ